MRVTIVPADQYVSVDGIGFSNLDLSLMAPDIHAIQWYETYGEVEIKDPTTGRMLRNDVIDSLGPYQLTLDAWQAAKTEGELLVASNQPEVIGAQIL